jgi:ABC-type xylose transport system permease subunit
VVDNGALAAIGAAIVGFGIVAFMFRIQRALQEREGRQKSWIPWADRLLVGIVTVTLLLVLFPIALAGSASSLWGGRLQAAACSASTVALVGYIPALLAHYNLGSRLDRLGSRLARKWSWLEVPQPTRPSGVPVERVTVIASVVLGVVAAVASVVVTG